MDQPATVAGIFVGTARTRWPGRPDSAIGKAAVDRPVHVGLTGLIGDQQADLRVHGGRGKAVHVYPAAHYPAWRGELGPNPAFAPGGFGENVALDGWDETEVAIGDVWRMGGATVAVSQGRQPCWKLAAHVGIDDLPARFRDTGRTGWYLRVIEEGAVAPGDVVSVLERRHPDWTVRRVVHALFDERADDPAEAAALAALEALDVTWRQVFAARAARAEAGA
jgi:MOSC domain-containing protein YiiM